MLRRSVLKTLGLAMGARAGATPLSRWAAAPQGFAGSPGGVSPASSPAVWLNQLGYLPHTAKVASVRGVPGETTPFALRSTIGDSVVFQGALGAATSDAASGDLLRQADFSRCDEQGTFVLTMGDHRSDPFRIGPDVYSDALRAMVRGYTGQRCGCAVDLGNGYAHPPCHLNGAYGATSGKQGPLPNHGGWHDAGDYGRYIVNSGITCGTLLWAWELYPDALQGLHLGFQKQHGALPDFLEEVLWNLSWMLQLQEPDGGVFHKQTSDQFCGFILPQDDHLVSHVIGTGAAPYKSTAATADLAAVMAIAARCYRPFDATLAARFLHAAQSAWAWGEAHPEVPFSNPPGIGTGAYGDTHLADEQLWASAELWRTTGEKQYEQAFLHGLPTDLGQLNIAAPSWATVGSMACWTYALANRAGDARIKTAIRTATQAAAGKLVNQGHENGYGNTLAESDYIWGSNGVAGNQSMLLALAHHFDPGSDTVAASLANLHYMLGRNCFGISWLTGVGTRSVMHPHHRPSAADNIVAPWPGLLSGGPNRRGGDKVADALPKAPPMRMWVDDTAAYSMNEIAINWNAPLVFLLAFANSPASRG